AVEKETGREILVEIKNREDFRNYKVDCSKAREYLGFAPRYGVNDIVSSLWRHHQEYGDMSQTRYYNIEVFKQIMKQDGKLR
ncbi:MAG: hypothetical protein KAH38_06050, partial [Candidatus Hydrogenedentes bacterium]|nr:hypothetical protein [Candidatus Hydrogenedentota bacterium]